MTEKELNNKILEEFKRTSKIHVHNNKLIHQKSISNFVDHLIIEKKNQGKKIKNSNREELSRIRKKELLLDYLIKLNNNSEINDEISEEYFQDFIKPLGTYMNSYYGFSFIGGGATIVQIMVIITITLIIDYLIYFIFDQVFYFTILSMVIFIIRKIRKLKQNKVFGYKY